MPLRVIASQRGSFAIRYCASTNTNITFKVLSNKHTSMTGGQEIMGGEPIATMVSDLLANGVKKVIVTSNRPDRLPVMSAAS